MGVVAAIVFLGQIWPTQPYLCCTSNPRKKSAKRLYLVFGTSKYYGFTVDYRDFCSWPFSILFAIFLDHQPSEPRTFNWPHINIILLNITETPHSRSL